MSERPNYQVRRLAESHRPALLSYLRRDKDNNRFLLNKVAEFGVSGGRIAFWGALDGARLAGVAMRLDAGAGICTTEPDCLPALVPLISPAENLSGPLGVMEAALALIPPERLVWRQVEWLCRLPADGFVPAPLLDARPAGEADIPGLAALYAQSDSFSRRTAAEVADHVRRDSARCRYYVASAGGAIAGAAAIAAKTADSAMIVSVFTAPAHRGRGLGAAVVTAACAELLEGGLKPYLMYREENEAAGRLYARLGFRQVGKWLMARLTPVT